MIITQTPYRISLFGGGTDFPEWYLSNRGSVLSFTIDKYCYISARILPPFFEHKYRIVYSKIETPNSIDKIRHPAVREAIRKYCPTHGLEIQHHGDLPARSGVGSSSAFAVGLIHALLKLTQVLNVNPEILARDSILLEREILRENVGIQDQVACSYGGFNYITFKSGEKSWRVEKLEPKREALEQIQENLFLMYSGVSRFSSDITSGTITSHKLRQEILSRLVDIAEQGRTIVQKSQSLDLFGELLHESWILKQKLNPLSVTPELASMYQSALENGATGGKVLGAGGGGFMLFWVPPSNQLRFRDFVKRYLHVPFKIESKGTQCILN
jgi:D-glycero-alpha-D-manno-heptose-7-phosphate kinase